MRKGQAALEFLTTYGWAFLIILTAIGALAYFGVIKINPPSRCTIAPEFICYDYQLGKTGGTDANMTLIIGNGKDFHMQITKVVCTFPDGSESDPAVTVGWDLYNITGDNQLLDSWEPGERRILTCELGANEDGNFITKDKAKVRFTITYKNQDIEGFEHTVDGEVISEVFGT